MQSMKMVPNPGLTTTDIHANISTWSFDGPDTGVVQHNKWSLGFWLSWDQLDAQIGADGNRLFPWLDIGPISLAPADSATRWRASTGSLRGLVCRYSRDAFTDLTGLDSDAPHDTKSWLALGRFGGTRLQYTLKSMSRELSYPGDRSEKMLESLCTQAAIELGRLLRRARGTPNGGGLAPWQLRHVRDAIESLPEDAGGDGHEVARSCGISQRHLSRAFKQSTGKTLREYAEEIRIERAQKLLVHSRVSVNDIATKLGFAHVSGFSIAFKRSTGQSPRSFRLRFTVAE